MPGGGLWRRRRKWSEISLARRPVNTPLPKNPRICISRPRESKIDSQLGSCSRAYVYSIRQVARRVLRLNPVMCNQERTSNGSRQTPILFKSAILLLLLALGALSTFTRVSQYYPQSSSVHYVSIANKMKPAHPGPILKQRPLHLVARILPPQPAVRLAPRLEPEIPFTRRIGLIVSLQHRSPPSYLA